MQLVVGACRKSNHSHTWALLRMYLGATVVLLCMYIGEAYPRHYENRRIAGILCDSESTYQMELVSR